MYRSTLTAVAVAGLLAFGCEDKTEAEKAADNAGSAANKQLDEVKEKSKDAESEVKNNTNAATEAMKDGADSVNSEIKSLVNKAQDAIKDRKWDEAEAHVRSIDTLKNKLPEGARASIDDMVKNVRTAIDNGRKMAPAAAH
jgi:phage-related protein